MHAFQSRLNVERFLQSQEAYQPFFDLVSSLDTWASKFEVPLRNLAERANPADAVEMNKVITTTRQAVSRHSARQVFRAIDLFKDQASSLFPTEVGEGGMVADLVRDTGEFENFYDAFVATQTGLNALPILLSAGRLKIRIQSFYGALRLLAAMGGEEPKPGGEEATFSLLLPAPLGMIPFIEKLRAIHALYSELCMLFAISESDHPLQISKIESGSLWAKVFGESRIINMMIAFVQDGAAWVYRNYTEEGKVASLPGRVAAIDSLLCLSERLKEAGHDFSAMQPNIDKAAVIVAKSLVKLLDDQPSVTVNKKTISLHEFGLERLGMNAQRQLTSEEPNDDDRRVTPLMNGSD